MSDTKVKELPEAQSVGANDLLYLVASDTDYKVKGSTVKDFVKPAVMSGATSIAPGSEGLVPAPVVGDNTKYFSGDGTYKQPALSEMSDDATHRLVTDTEKNTWSNKQDALEFDDEPTDGSNNPVKSNGIYDALATKANSADLATVATTGDYDDLTDKPTIPVIEANPSGEATAEMQKLQIDSTIYKFATQKAYGEITDVDIASFSDGADDEPLAKLEVGIEAVQDLNGYDAPWPAGGGKNKFNPSYMDAAPYYSISGDTITVNGSDGRPWQAVPTYNLKAGTYTISRVNVGKGGADIRFSTEDFNTQHYFASSPYTFTLENDAQIKIKIGTSASTYPFTDYIQIESGSTATSFAPYSNECPISGWTGANIYDAGGENIFDNSTFVKGRLDNGVIGYADNTTSMTITETGVIFTTNSNYRGVVSGLTPVVGGKSYYFDFDADNASNISAFIDYYDSSSNWISRSTFSNLFTPPSNCSYVRISFQEKTSGTITVTNIAIYNANVYTIQLGDTYYGGKLDVTSGVLTVDRVYYQFNNSKTYSITGSARETNRWITSMTNIPNVSNKIKSRSGVISSISPRDAEYTSITISGFCRNLSSPYPIFNLNDSDSGLTASSSATDIANAVNTFLHQHTPQVVYELATPFTIQLTPTQVKSLLKDNNIWADSGQIVDVVYVRDLNTYLKSLDDRITALENA